MDLTRYYDNIEILKIVAKYIDKNPQIRFNQALWNLGIINRIGDTLEIEDKFHEEPKETLKKLKIWELTCTD